MITICQFFSTALLKELVASNAVSKTVHSSIDPYRKNTPAQVTYFLYNNLYSYGKQWKFLKRNHTQKVVLPFN